MKHYKIIFILTSFICLGMAQANEKSASEISSELDKLDKEYRKVDLFEKLATDLKTINSVRAIKPYMDWLKRKVLTENNTFRYATLYSFYLWKVDNKEMAEMMMFQSQLRLETDFSRCENKNIALNKYKSWYEGGQLGKEILESFNNRSEKDKKEIIDISLMVEKGQKNRPGDAWLCSGIDWKKALANQDKLVKKEIKNSGNVGKTVAVTATKDILIGPSFTSNSEWNKQRSTIRIKLKEKYL